MTPREFYRESEAAQQRWQDECERDLVLAWQTASLAMRAMNGKLPDLKVLIENSRRARTSHQTLSDLTRQLVGVLGIPGRPASPETVAALRLVKRVDG